MFALPFWIPTVELKYACWLRPRPRQNYATMQNIVSLLGLNKYLAMCMSRFGIGTKLHLPEPRNELFFPVRSLSVSTCHCPQTHTKKSSHKHTHQNVKCQWHESPRSKNTARNGNSVDIWCWEFLGFLRFEWHTISLFDDGHWCCALTHLRIGRGDEKSLLNCALLVVFLLLQKIICCVLLLLTTVYE